MAEHTKPGETWWQRILTLEPAVLRGFLLSLAAMLALVTGHTVIDDDAITVVLDAFAGLTALVSAFWTRGAVVPVAKVVSYLPDPGAQPSDLRPGPAVVPEDVSDGIVVDAARLAA